MEEPATMSDTDLAQDADSVELLPSGRIRMTWDYDENPDGEPHWVTITATIPRLSVPQLMQLMVDADELPKVDRGKDVIAQQLQAMQTNVAAAQRILSMSDKPWLASESETVKLPSWMASGNFFSTCQGYWLTVPLRSGDNDKPQVLRTQMNGSTAS